MFQSAYTSDTWKAVVQHSQNRLEAIRPLVEILVGVIQNARMTLGEYEAALIFDLPDNVSAAAFAATIAAGGAARTAKRTPLMSIAALSKAQRTSAYKLPSA